jgi:hypothetical protein
MRIIYCKPRMAEFALDSKKLPDPMPVAEAHRLHKARKCYEAVLVEGGLPEYIVTVDNNYVVVDFVDSDMILYMQYQFQERQPGRLFLTHIFYWDIADETDNPRGMKSMVFEENGYIYMMDEDFVAGTAIESETNHDPTANWDDYPEFGNYAHLCRAERD